MVRFGVFKFFSSSLKMSPGPKPFIQLVVHLHANQTYVFSLEIRMVRSTRTRFETEQRPNRSVWSLTIKLPDHTAKPPRGTPSHTEKGDHGNA